ncbi:ATP F0F1 synthase subunit B [Phenylobacterium sp. Root77]|jgi:F-type H+-transporting ATPase subunit b|uniref:F0F1 ATP synthase subunit B n=1 Tax=unclassified Phenylobacterium TaxID=2640670 RepID=UPI0006FE2C12|nr:MULTISPECIES: F0F1 ATP synthase subunit B [unclassified Phenylobacterium]KQW73107.1 ATP F0F1 synthase subunit B [Phenylobacterium sp. Root1277]KQW92326.1 ATP F0F1 synthase subunit B [Phenylobacterium sp. Root1290]KRC40557.1 ATP F0F1 synthase subunit B [Phenylobacterium sp. Root77]
MPAFLIPSNPEFWVGAGLLIFLGIVIFVAKAPKTINAALDATTAKIQADLDEAARIREEAQRLLAQLKAERAEAEVQAKEMLAAAQDEARRYEAEAKAKLEESLARRQQLAERKIANAEAQAAAEVKAAAADLAAQAAEVVLTKRLAGTKTDPLVDRAISQLSSKLQ